MISALVMICALHPVYCHSATARAFARDVDAEVPDDGLRAWLVDTGAHESGFSPSPPARSWDARAGKSCGFLQMRCDFVRTHSPREQIREWIRNVQASSIACVFGSCGAVQLAATRAREVQRLLELVADRGVQP